MQVASRKYARVPSRCVTLVSDVCPRIRGTRGARCQRASASLPLSQLAVDKGPVLLWFKSDLRTDDHEGLAALVRAPAVLPVFVLDPHQLEPLTFLPAGPEVAGSSAGSGQRAVGGAGALGGGAADPGGGAGGEGGGDGRGGGGAAGCPRSSCGGEAGTGRGHSIPLVGLHLEPGP
ncbi:photolyase/cryptochrome alpha/beta domain-containing protein, partial [Haematococcus lacustris]